MSLVEDLDHAYEILGLARGATREEVTARYRELAKKYHPDLFHAEDIPEELRHQATEKIKAINEAYRTIITGISSSSGPAIKSSSEVEIAWKFDATYQVFGPPVIAGGVIYFCNRGPAMEYRDGSLFALDLATAKQRWKFRTGGEATSFVSVKDGIAYFGSSDRYLYAINVNGPDVLWKVHTQNPIKRTPIVADGMIFSQHFEENSLTALEAKTGKKKWKFGTAGEVVYNPAVADGTAYFSTAEGYLYSLDLKSRKLNWRVQEKSFAIFEPVISGDLVLFVIVDHGLIALERKSGRQIWFRRIGPMSGMWTDGIAVHDGVVFSPSEYYEREQHEGSDIRSLEAIDAASGGLLWKSPTKMDLFYTPVIHDGVVYTSSLYGQICAFDLKSGRNLWDFDLEKWTYRLAAHQGIIYIGGWDALYALKPLKGISEDGRPSQDKPKVGRLPAGKKQLRAK